MNHQLKSPTSDRKYYIFYVGMTAITLCRLLLNFTGFFLILWAIRDFAPQTTDYSVEADLPYEYTMQTFYVLRMHPTATAGGWCLLASTLLHLVAYVTHRNHLIRKVLHENSHDELSVPIFWTSHVSVLNWLFDIPGIGVPTVKWVHVLILLINITAGLVFFCALWFERPMTLAWGCYAPDTPITELKFGLCPQYMNDPQNAHPPVCDQPGARCGEEAIRWKNMLGHAFLHAGVILMFSLALYFISVSTKARFYVLSRDLVATTGINKRV